MRKYKDILKYIWNRVVKNIGGRAIKDSVIDRTAKIGAGSTVIQTMMGKYSFCGYDCKLINCKIGAFCSIADFVSIGLAEHPITWVSTSPVFYRGRDSIKKKFSKFEREEVRTTTIGNDVWIGEHVLIKGGITIGNGAIVGMGSVVTHDVKDFEIVAGVPARHIGFRFEENVRAQLSTSEWWNLDDEVLEKHAENIRDSEKFIEGLK